jgi:glutamine transport system permease protein
MGFVFDAKAMVDALPLLMGGLWLTIVLTVAGLFFGFILGTVSGLAKVSRSKTLQFVSTVYVESVRGTPIIVQAMFLYFGLPLALGLSIPPITAGVIVIALNSGAYISEIVRGAIQSIDKGQMEAGRSIGLTRFQTMCYIIWPQAFRRMIPPLGNQFIISLKDTSLLMVIGVSELARRGQEIISFNYKAFEVWLTVALIYLSLTLLLARLLRMLEKRLSHYSR